MGAVLTLTLILISLASTVPHVAVAKASSAGPAGVEPSRFSCRRTYESFGDLARSQASMDLYHGLAYFGAAGGIAFGGSPSTRWSSKNAFDVSIRDEFRLDSSTRRSDADDASNFTHAFTTAILPAATIGAHFLERSDCVETWDMFTDVVESYGLTIFLSEAVKMATGRSRPYADACASNDPPPDARCGRGDRSRSFFSGHASLAAAGAGLTCSFAIRREAWGSSSTAQATPCAVGVVAALTTGALRIMADRHWGTDVLVGFGVGALVGYFDTWGPLDLLKFETRNAKGKVSSVGMVLPHVQEGRLGARLVMVF